MKRTMLLVCCLTAVLKVAAEPTEQRPPDALAVRIVPDSFREQGKRSITLWQPTQHFHVIVTNISDQPVRLWREWCSWGEQMLSFETTDVEDNVTTVKRTVRAYRKNYPDWTLLPPGDHMVFEVSFAPATWENPPLPEAGKSRVVTMRAVFEIAADGQTKDLNVWTGKVASPVETYTIYR